MTGEPLVDARFFCLNLRIRQNNAVPQVVKHRNEPCNLQYFFYVITEVGKLDVTAHFPG
jgi:hypothetical protein